MRGKNWKSVLLPLIGPFATVATTLAIEAISRSVYRIPAPGAFLLLMVAAGAYVGGIASGLLCAVLVTVYVFFIVGTGSAAFASTDALDRAVVMSLTAFAMAVLVGLLRRRTVIAETRRLEAMTQLSDRRFSLLFDAAPVGILISRSTIILHANPEFFETFGYQPEELLGKSFDVLLAPSVRDEIIDRTNRRELGETVITAYETVGVRKDGSELPFLVNVTRLDLSDGPATLAFITDISDRRQAEQAVIQLNRNTEFSLNSARVGSWQIDLKSMELTCSTMCKANFGRAADEPFTCEQLWESIHPDDRQHAREAVHEAVVMRTAYQAEYRVIWPNGELHWIVARGRGTYDTDGAPLFIAGITLDITDRRRAAEELRLSQDRLAFAAEGAGLGMWYCDLPFDKLVWNSTCKEHFGVPPDAEVNIDTFYEMIHPDDREHTRKAIEASIANHSLYTVDYRTVSAGGRLRWIRAAGRCYYDSNGKPVRFDGITMDLTEQKRVELAIEEARKAAENANAAKDHFLAVLSHELRTPLTPVLASVQLMATDSSLTPDLREGLDVVRRNVELEARLIDDLLDLTRIAKGKLRLEMGTVDAHELLRQAVAICLSELNRKGLQLVVDLQAEHRHVLADPARLQQVCWNLLNNAVKFTPTGGQITLRSINSDDGKHLSIEVIDTGIGIDPEVVPRLFHAFEQAEETFSRRFGGLGLGLTISKSLVDMHGGRLSASSEGQGRGARFVIELQTVAAPTPPRMPQPCQPRAAGGAGLRILLVDDHEDTNRALRRLLQQLGYQVQSAFSMKSALEVAGSDEFDLLISDIGLPDGSGLELMRQLLVQGKMKPLKGIALSGFGMEEDVRKSLEAGFKDHLTKPVSFEKLEAAIREVATEPTTSL